MPKPTTAAGHGPGRALHGADHTDNVEYICEIAKAIAAAQAPENKTDEQAGVDTTVCVIGSGGAQTFDFHGLSYDEAVQAAADAVVAAGQTADIITVPNASSLSKAVEDAVDAFDKGSPSASLEEETDMKAISDGVIASMRSAIRCLDRHELPSSDDTLFLMFKMILSSDTRLSGGAAYARLTRLAMMEERLSAISSPHCDEVDESWHSLCGDCIASVCTDSEFPMMASAFRTIGRSAGLKGIPTGTYPLAKRSKPRGWGLTLLVTVRDVYFPGKRAPRGICVSMARILCAIRILAQECPVVPSDGYSDLDKHPIWRQIANNDVVFCIRNESMFLARHDAMKAEADRVAEKLLSEENAERIAKAAALGSAASKSSKRRARQKQKKAQAAVMESIDEDEEVATATAESALGAVLGVNEELGTAQSSRAPLAAERPADQAPARDELGKYIEHRMQATGESASPLVAPPSYKTEPAERFLDLSEVGSALASADDAATSVATALQCVICFSNERAVAVVPCGHRCLCEDCAKHEVIRDKKCPLCRSEIKMFMRVYD